MKKYCFVTLILFFMFVSTVYAQDISVFVNNSEIELKGASPQFKKDIIYVPINFISKELGAEIKWKNPNVMIVKGDNQIVYAIDNLVAYKNDRALP